MFHGANPLVKPCHGFQSVTREAARLRMRAKQSRNTLKESEMRSRFHKIVWLETLADVVS